MRIKAKICGLNTRESVGAAVAGGASMIGFVFYGPSPRYVSPEQARELGRGVSKSVRRVGLFVDAGVNEIEKIASEAPLEALQLHGSESPETVARIRNRLSLPVIKAIKLSHAADLESANDYIGAADMLLFDARAPESLADALPGGNGLVFDWRILTAFKANIPWILAGGLTAENVATAVATSGARIVDTSSGVESRPGVKDTRKIKAFLEAVARCRLAGDEEMKAECKS